MSAKDGIGAYAIELDFGDDCGAVEENAEVSAIGAGIDESPSVIADEGSEAMSV